MTTTSSQFAGQYPTYVLMVAFGAGMLTGWLIASDIKRLLCARDQQRQWKASEGKAYKRAISRWEGEGGAILPSKKGSQR